MSSYYGQEILRDIADGAYIGIDAANLSLSRECQDKFHQIMEYHISFLDVKHDFQPKRIGSELEKKQFWKLMDAAEEMLRKELQPDKFVLVSVKGPDPNPFSE